MVKKGDTVRFLNTTGGGTVTRVDGKIVYVEENGFETPVLASEVVVVMPAGHQSDTRGATLMFDQKAFDAAQARVPETPGKPQTENEARSGAESGPQPVLPGEDGPDGDKINIIMAFEPSDLRHIDKASFNMVLVNDSFYTLSFIVMRRADDERGWNSLYEGIVNPNEMIDIAQFTHENLHEIERVAVQCFAYKRGREFEMHRPMGCSRRLDLTKFHKVHCFRPGAFFDNPVIEVPFISDSKPVADLPTAEERNDEGLAETLMKKYSRELREKDKPKGKKKNDDAANPHKLLPLIEVDLHISELTDTTAGMEAKDMLAMQLDEVRRTMKQNSRRVGQKIVFIHGKGEGVLRKEVLALLHKEYPKAELQDASFREYGFGATLVTVH